MTNTAFLQQLPSLIRAHRKKSQLTQQGLALLAGVGKTAVFDVEHGKASVQLDTLLRILGVLNIELTLDSPLMTSMRTVNEKS